MWIRKLLVIATLLALALPASAATALAEGNVPQPTALTAAP